MTKREFVYALAGDLEFAPESIWEYFEFLEDLRQSGVTNMFGAVPYLKEYDSSLDENKARKVLSGWMKSYSMED